MKKNVIGRRRIGGQFGRPSKGDFQAQVVGNIDDFIVVGTEDHPIDASGVSRLFNRPCKQWFSHHGDDVFSRERLGPAPGRNHR